VEYWSVEGLLGYTEQTMASEVQTNVKMKKTLQGFGKAAMK
jgi:hypothetical protein